MGRKTSINPLSVWRAEHAYKEFTGDKPSRSHVENLDNGNVAGYRLGSLVGVAYEATRDGKTDQYFHRFQKRARPELVARSDGNKLYIAGGKYHVTDRGIEDKKVMPHLFVVNPSRRKRRRTAKRRSSTGQFLANPRRRKKRSAPVMAAPRRRRRRIHRRRSVSYARNPIMLAPRRRRRSRHRISMRRYRRNPGRRMGGKGAFNITGVLLPGVMVGAGAVGAELLMGYLPLPSMLTTGPARYLTKGVISVMAGWAIAKYANRKAGEAFALGGVAIAAHDAIKASITGFLPGAKFGEYMGGYNWDKYGYNMPSMNSYPNNPGIGYYSPGTTLAPEQAMGEYFEA